MRIYFYPECNFNINKAKTYDVTSLAEWFDSQHKNPDDYEIVGKDGESHDSAYEAEVCAVYPRIMGGKSKGKNILKVVVGLALVLATGGTTAALFSNIGGLSMAHTLGAGLLLSGGGALLMGKMKMPSMDLTSDSATKENYQWNVGNLSTSRGVKGVTFGSDVIPEGELLAYRTYGTNSIEKVVRSSKAAGWYYQGDYNKTYAKKISGIMGNYYKWLPGYTEYASVSTDSSSYLEMLIGCGEGELDSITDIKINDISVSDLEMVQDVDYAIRLGSNTQTALKQTDLDSQAGYQSIGQTVPVKLNGSVTPLLITTPSDCDSCCIAFQVPNWYMYDTSSGAKNSAFIKLKIGYRTSGSSGSYTYLTKTGIAEIDNTTALKSESAFYFQVVIKFPSNGTYQICIENDSAELNNAKGLLSAAEYSGSALPDRAAINISVDNIACYNNKEQTYPNTALIWLRIPASQTLNGSMPKVTWKQTRASIYAYNGSSYVTKPADNLAWAIYDIIAQVRKDGNTYHNEGEDVANIDFDKFVAFASFCDSIGAKGNWFLNKLDTSWSNAMSVATSCRAFIGLRSGKVCPYWDAPTEMTQIFTVGNYEDMSGVITAKKDRAKAIEATFNNEEEKFASRTVRVEIDNDHSAEAVSMTFAGLSNPVNVSKQAHYILRRNKYLVQSVKFTADIDSIVCELNDVIGIQCDLTEYGVGGRIFKVENNVISLDATVTLESGKTYALLVRHTDGTLERNTPIETNGTFTQLTFNSAWSKPVLKGDIYSFGIANSEVRKYRVTGITRTNDLKAQIEAIEYNENVYDELAVAPYTYTNPNAGINNVTTTYTPEAVELAWDANNNTSYVNVYVDGVFYGRYQNGAQIPNINSEQLVEMFPVNEYGEEDTPVVRTISNNLPTPSTPPVPIVQSTTTGCVAEFDGIPKNENIVWLIIKEGDNELGRANILGEYMSVSIQLRSGTHTLSAYFVNQFSKSSQARTFTATPLGDIQANDISATALKLPTGSILRLSAKNCTTASIAEANGVKDVSGNGNHGKANGDVSVTDGGESFYFSRGSNNNGCLSFDSHADIVLNLTEISLSFRFNAESIETVASNTYSVLFLIFKTTSTVGSLFAQASVYPDGQLRTRLTLIDGNTTETEFVSQTGLIEANKEYCLTLTSNFTNNKTFVYLNGEQIGECNSGTGSITVAPSTFNFGSHVMGAAYKNYRFKGTMRDIRIYPRALSASEIKTIYMFPDDATFGQLTADLIGANIIKGINLFSENIITQAAQINQAVFQSLIVTNGSTVANQVDVGGRNLVRNSKVNKTNVTTYEVARLYLGDDRPTENAQVTIQIKGTLQSGLTYFNVYNTTSQTVRARLTENDKENGVYKKTFSWKIGGTSNSAIIIYQSPRDSITTGSSIEWIKLEYGNKATTWTPAPEDVDSSIASGDSTTLASAKSYADGKASTAQSNAEAAAAAALAAVTNNIYYTGTTKINGGIIETGSVGAAAIAANSVTAEKLNITTQIPSKCIFRINVTGITATSAAVGTVVPNQGLSKLVFKVAGAAANLNSWTNSLSGGSGTGQHFLVPSGGAILATKTGVTIGTAFTFCADVDQSQSIYNTVPCVFDMRQAASDTTNRVYIGFNSNLNIRLVIHDSDGTQHEIYSTIKGLAGLSTRFGVSVNGNNIIFVINGISETKTLANSRVSATMSRFAVGNFINLPANRQAGHISFPTLWNQALTANQMIMLLEKGILWDNEAGEIRADRIATDAIRSRNYAYSSGLYSTAGTFLDLANGQIISKNFSIDSSGNASFKGAVTATSGKIGDFSLDNGALSYSGTSYGVSSGGIIKVKNTTTGSECSINAGMLKYESSSSYTNIQAAYASFSSGGGSVRINPIDYGSSYSYALVQILPNDTSKYGLYVAGKARINTTDYGSDEKTKKDFQDVSTLDKLKKLRVCAWRFDEEKLVEKDNAFIDEENIKIEAENKAIDEENKAIEAENKLRKKRKDGEKVELIPLKEHIKLREHRIADKNANHPLNIGCMAGEFNKAFGTNDGSEDCLSVTDVVGVCMRAIQELAEISDAQKIEIDSQKAEIAELKAKLKIQQDSKSDVELETSYTEKSDSSKDADNLEFADVGKMFENKQEEQK